jgi:6-pyruvoyltetrahydropterin/6-carboxytetrahydropterin synthase
MADVYLTRRAAFCAAHRLYLPDLSDAENLALFGKCAMPGGHGHNYEIEVTLVGRPDPRTGMVVDLKKVKEILHERIVDRWDHQNLNSAVPELQGVVPTAENLAIAVWNGLAGRIPGARLHRVRLRETENNTVEYYGPDGSPAPGLEE